MGSDWLRSNFSRIYPAMHVMTTTWDEDAQMEFVEIRSRFCLTLTFLQYDFSSKCLFHCVTFRNGWITWGISHWRRIMLLSLLFLWVGYWVSFMFGPRGFWLPTCTRVTSPQGFRGRNSVEKLKRSWPYKITQKEIRNGGIQATQISNSRFGTWLTIG